MGFPNFGGNGLKAMEFLTFLKSDDFKNYRNAITLRQRQKEEMKEEMT